jgi:hypothetical protein
LQQKEEKQPSDLASDERPATQRQTLESNEQKVIRLQIVTPGQNENRRYQAEVKDENKTFTGLTT